MGFPGGPGGKEPTCRCWRLERPGLIPQLGRCSGCGLGNPLQHPCLENPMDTGAWGSTVQRVAESQT